MSTELIPAIDLREGQVVRLLQGDYARQTSYAVDPVDTAKRFQDAGCRWLHVVDLDGARDGRPVNLPIIEKIVRATDLQVEVGGGIRTQETMEQLLASGVNRLVLGTRAIADFDWFGMMAHHSRFRQRLILGLDARDGRVATHGWTQQQQQAPHAVDIARAVQDWPLAAIIYTDIARDGALMGPNISATRQLLEAAGDLPVIHSGGITTLEDIAALKSLSLAGIIVGRALYEGRLEVRQAVELLAATS